MSVGDEMAQAEWASPEVRRGGGRLAKYTLCLTQRCNLACAYCYVPKRPRTMSLATARDAVDFIFRHAAGRGELEIGFFGGEPLLEFGLVQDLTGVIESHPAFDRARVGLTVVTNGTIFSEAIAGFLRDHAIRLCLSCDGAPPVQDRFRRSATGEPSSARVVRTIRGAIESLPSVLVNAVYRPETLEYLADTVRFLSGLGLRQLYLNPDFSARWTPADLDRLAGAYEAVADAYVGFYREGDPRFVSLIDNKIAVLLRGGYHPLERCSIGRRELAFTPDRRIFPCERLIGDTGGDDHAIGTLDTGLDLSRMRCRRTPEPSLNGACVGCGLRDLCMHWCGCSNYFQTGRYDRVGPFLCASEKAAIEAAIRAFTALERERSGTFVHHLIGRPHLNSLALRAAVARTPTRAADLAERSDRNHPKPEGEARWSVPTCTLSGSTAARGTSG